VILKIKKMSGRVRRRYEGGKKEGALFLDLYTGLKLLL
jgi:hypothetical protein